MSLKRRLMRLGSWQITLRPGTPQSLVDAAEEFGHIVVTDSEIPEDMQDDTVLADARYTGVIRAREESGRQAKLSGSGMAFWLGDEDGKGAVYEGIKDFTDDTMADAVRALLPAAVQEGTLHSVPGTFTGRFRFVSPREAIDYVTETLDAEWRVNPDGTLDAGTADQLFGSIGVILVANDAPTALDLESLRAGGGKSAVNAEDYTTRVIVVGKGDNGQFISATDEVDTVPYKDLHGNDVDMRRVISESSTSDSSTAAARAALHLNRFKTLKEGVKADEAEYDWTGTLAPGQSVYVYDPANGLIDLNNEVEHGGELIYPMAMRVLSTDEPLQPGQGVYLRTGSGEWHDLSRHVERRGGGVRVELDTTVPQGIGGGGALQNRTDPEGDNTTTPNPPSNLAATSSVYIDPEGSTRARITLTWTDPTQNTDGSTLTDPGHIRLRWADTGLADSSYTVVDWDAEAAVLDGLEPGATYNLSARAVDSGSNRSTWTTIQHTAESDTIAPSTPSQPDVVGGAMRVFLTHDLTAAAGGALESDLDHLEVHASTSSSFTPDDSTHVADVQANQAMIERNIDAATNWGVDDVLTLHVAVRAVDRAGNRSPKSGEATVTPQRLDGVNLVANSVTANQMAAGSITATELAADSVTAAAIAAGAVDTGALAADAVTAGKVSAHAVDVNHLNVGNYVNLIYANPGFEEDVIDGPDDPHYYIGDAWTTATGTVFDGARSLRIDAENIGASGDAVSFLGDPAVDDNRTPCEPGEAFLFTAWMIRGSTALDGHAFLQTRWYDDTGGLLSGDTTHFDGNHSGVDHESLSGTWTQFSHRAEAPDAADSVEFRIVFSNDNTVDTAVFIDKVRAYRMVGSAQINELTWDKGFGGLLELGGVNDQRGVLTVQDSEGEDVLAQIDGERIVAGPVRAGDIDAGKVTASRVDSGGDGGGEVATDALYLHSDGNLRMDDPVEAFPRGISRRRFTADASANQGGPRDEQGTLVTHRWSPQDGWSYQLYYPAVASEVRMWRRAWSASAGEWGDWIEYSGTAISGSGGAGGGTSTDTWDATWTRSWRDTFNEWRDNTDVYQGDYGYGNHRGYIGFDHTNIQNVLSGRTIEKVELTITRKSSGGASGDRTPTWWLHQIASDPGGGDAAQPSLNSGTSTTAGSWSWGETRTATLPDSYGADLRDNNAKGIAIYDGSGSPYMIFDPSPIELKIRHS